MKVLRHADPRSRRRPRARALPPAWLIAVLALPPLLLASCTDDVAANCPPLGHPEVVTVAAASTPCAGRMGESGALLALRVVRTHRRTTQPTPGAPNRYPVRCGNTRSGYLHLLDERAHGN
jgi:hypothetical protein